MYHVAVWDEYDGWKVIYSSRNKERAEFWVRYFIRHSEGSVHRGEFAADIIAW